jgi:hypothetical protein
MTDSGFSEKRGGIQDIVSPDMVAVFQRAGRISGSPEDRDSPGENSQGTLAAGTNGDNCRGK